MKDWSQGLAWTQNPHNTVEGQADWANGENWLWRHRWISNYLPKLQNRSWPSGSIEVFPWVSFLSHFDTVGICLMFRSLIVEHPSHEFRIVEHTDRSSEARPCGLVSGGAWIKGECGCGAGTGDLRVEGSEIPKGNQLRGVCEQLRCISRCLPGRHGPGS